MVVVHEPDVIGKVSGHSLPPEKDPLRRVRAWKETARLVGEARQTLLAEGKPVFIIGAHYGVASQVAFHLPEARAVAQSARLVYVPTSDRPADQFYFWPGYRNRKGENAIFIQELDLKQPELRPPPARLETEFSSVASLGPYEARYRNRVLRRFQFFACRGLR